MTDALDQSELAVPDSDLWEAPWRLTEEELCLQAGLVAPRPCLREDDQ